MLREYDIQCPYCGNERYVMDNISLDDAASDFCTELRCAHCKKMFIVEGEATLSYDARSVTAEDYYKDRNIVQLKIDIEE